MYKPFSRKMNGACYASDAASLATSGAGRTATAGTAAVISHAGYAAAEEASRIQCRRSRWSNLAVTLLVSRQWKRADTAAVASTRRACWYRR